MMKKILFSNNVSLAQHFTNLLKNQIGGENLSLNELTERSDCSKASKKQVKLRFVEKNLPYIPKNPIHEKFVQKKYSCPSDKKLPP